MGANKVYPCSSKICNMQKPSAANEDPDDWTFIIIFVNILT